MPALKTEPAPSREINWFRSGEPVLQTGVSFALQGGTKSDSVVRADTLRDVNRDQERPADQLSQRADPLAAVVLRCTDTSVAIKFKSGTEFELPLEVVPLEFRSFGQPIQLTVDRSQGIRRLKIEARVVSDTTLKQDDPDLDRWINSLP